MKSFTRDASVSRLGTQQIHLDVIATVPHGVQGDFIDAALRAKVTCPVSRLLIANISMAAKLKRWAAAARTSRP